MDLETEMFQSFSLKAQDQIWTAKLPKNVLDAAIHFENLWALHPEQYHTVKIHGKEIPTPRWQQAYGANYRYTGSQNNALPISDELKIYLQWCQEQIDPRLNALLLNWYDAQKAHYIGAHRDDTRDLIEGSPIVTISLGEARVFRFRPWKQKGYQDIPLEHGSVIIIPWETNLRWTHEVPHFKKYRAKRISITLRAFK